MTNHYNITVPVEVGQETKFRRVGVMFRNEKEGRTSFTIKLDFPIGVREMVCFEPREREDSGDAAGE